MRTRKSPAHIMISIKAAVTLGGPSGGRHPWVEPGTTVRRERRSPRLFLAPVSKAASFHQAPMLSAAAPASLNERALEAKAWTQPKKARSKANAPKERYTAKKPAAPRLVSTSTSRPSAAKAFYATPSYAPRHYAGSDTPYSPLLLWTLAVATLCQTCRMSWAPTTVLSPLRLLRARAKCLARW